jgi:LmbE family N-acetylglucosaminyl deacetylase
VAAGRGSGERLIVLELLVGRDARAPLNILCLGAHSDDIEIGCGGTILRLTRLYAATSIRWIVFSAASDERRDEALAGASRFLERAAERDVVIEGFRESFFPFAGEPIKEYFEALKSGPDPDLVFTHYRHDLHQDHKLVGELTWNTFRRSLILEYETPKWDGDLGTPNCYVRLSDEIAEQKVRVICDTFASQRTKPWFTPDTFRALMRLRGVESNAGFAEAFYARKLALG